MSTQTETTERTVRFGVSVRPFARIVVALAAVGLGFGLTGFLIGHAESGQVSGWMIGMMMLGLIPYGGLFVVAILGSSVSREVDDVTTAALTVAAAGIVGHFALMMLSVPFVMFQPIQPPIGDFVMMELWLRGTLATALVGALVGTVGARL